VMAGLRITLTHRMAARPEDEITDADALKARAALFAGVRATELPVYFVGPEADAVALYEQVFADCTGVFFRFLDAFEDPVVVPAPATRLTQIGFDEEDALLPNDNRIFRGFDLLREYFLFPRKFLGFRLTGLNTVMPKLAAKTVELILVFDEVNARLAAAVQRSMFALYAALAINLFEKTADRIPVKTNQHEYH